MCPPWSTLTGGVFGSANHLSKDVKAKPAATEPEEIMNCEGITTGLRKLDVMALRALCCSDDGFVSVTLIAP